MVTTCSLRLPCSTGTDGKLNGSTYSSEPILLPINDQLKQAAPQAYGTLKKIARLAVLSRTPPTFCGSAAPRV